MCKRKYSLLKPVLKGLQDIDGKQMVCRPFYKADDYFGKSSWSAVKKLSWQENPPFPSVQLGFFKEGFSQASVLSSLGVCKSVVLQDVKPILLNQVDKKSTDEPMLIFLNLSMA